MGIGDEPSKTIAEDFEWLQGYPFWGHGQFGRGIRIPSFTNRRKSSYFHSAGHSRTGQPSECTTKSKALPDSPIPQARRTTQLETGG